MGTSLQTASSLSTAPPLADGKSKPTIGGLRKAAILMVLLGDEAAVEIYRNLSPEDVRRLTQEIAEVETISPDEALQVLEEYRRLTLTRSMFRGAALTMRTIFWLGPSAMKARRGWPAKSFSPRRRVGRAWILFKKRTLSTSRNSLRANTRRPSP